MTERERAAARYAWVLGMYGEGSAEDQKFLDDYLGTGLMPLLIEVALATREEALKWQ